MTSTPARASASTTASPPVRSVISLLSRVSRDGDHPPAIHPTSSLALMDDPPRTPDFSFVHAADLHLDTPFKGIGITAPHVAAELREASLAAFDALVDLCLHR